MKANNKKFVLKIRRSNKNVYASISDGRNSVVSFSTLNLKNKSANVSAARDVGAAIKKIAQSKDIKIAAFDRGGHRFHGKIKALCDTFLEKGAI
jgi:large subunit ribosomal protein L18